MVSDFNMETAHPTTLPCPPDFDVHNISKTSTMLSKEDHATYRMKIGKFQWVTNSRPDIQYTVNQLSKVLNGPCKGHMAIADGLLRYMKGTSEYGIKYTMNGPGVILKGYVDSDWGGCTKTRKSTTGYIFYLND